MMTLLKVLKNNGGDGNASTSLFCASLRQLCGMGAAGAWLNGRHKWGELPPGNPRQRAGLTPPFVRLREILDGFGGQRLAANAPICHS
jgi:hypothetical protein